MSRRFFYLMILLALLVAGCNFGELPDGLPATDTPVATLSQSAPTDTPVSEPDGTLTAPSPTPSLMPAPVGTSPATEVAPVPEPSPTSAPPIRFFLQPGTPMGMQNFLVPEKGCDWMGLAGQIFNLAGEPILGLVIEAGGTLEGREIQAMAVTGGEAALGPGGYSITLADHPVASDGSLWLQVYRDGTAITGRILITTYGDCERNLILVNFIESGPFETEVRLPLILKPSP